MKYRPDIDGLRAIAVLAVIVFHAAPQFLTGGFVGVDVFFVISGFLITNIILKDLESGTFSLLNFYIRRIRRIFPALLVVLIAVLALGWWLLLPGELQALSRHATASAYFGMNFKMWTEAGYFGFGSDLKPLKHIWSLSMEEQFYLLFPMALAGLFRYRKFVLPALIGVTVLSYLTFFLRAPALLDGALFDPLLRFWEISAGCCLAVWPNRLSPLLKKYLSVLGSLLIAVAFLTTGMLMAVVGTVFLIAAGESAWINRRVLSLPILVGIGLISYPLYLWHWPLMAFYRVIHFGELPPLAMLEILLLSYLLARATYQFIERPKKWRWLVVGMVMVGFFASTIALFKGVPSRYPKDVRELADFKVNVFQGTRFGDCWLTENTNKNFADDCFDPEVVLWGDSHAAMLYRGLGDIGQLTRDRCPPIFAGVSPICQASNQFVLEELSKLQPATVILFANWTDYFGVTSGIQNTISQLQAMGVQKVILLGPAPQWMGELPRVLMTYYYNHIRQPVPQRLIYGTIPAIKIFDEELKSVIEGATYISVHDILCNEEGCLTRIDASYNSLTSWDYGHLTTPAAEYVAHRILPLLN